MKRSKSIKTIFLSSLLIFNLFVGVAKTFAEDLVSVFDNMFASGEYTLYTDQDTSDESAFMNVIWSWPLFNQGMQEYYNSPSDYSYIGTYGRSDAISCSYNDMACSFKLYRYTPSSTDLIKTYENIKITVNSDIGSDFPMMNGNNLEINYDESMFSSNEERNDYIRSYVSGFSASNGLSWAAYDYDDYLGVIQKKEYEGSKPIKSAVKKIDNIVFSYNEAPYSADFQRLTSGTLIVKTDADITEDLLADYIWRKVSGTYSFNLDGRIKNDKVFIKMTKYENGQQNVLEKHLVTIVKDPNIDLALFESFGFGEYVDIKADTPSNKSEYLSNFFNMAQSNVNYDDGYAYISGTSADSNTAMITYSYNSYTAGVNDVQIHLAPIRFVGYDSNKSEAYASIVGDKIIIRGDRLDSQTISENIQNMNSGDYSMRMLGCNDDYTECDIALINWQTKEFEIHKVSIELDDSISDEFKASLNINEDGTIDIINDTSLTSWNQSVSGYNEDAGSYIYIYCNSNNICRATLTNYRNRTSEIHEFRYKMVNLGRTINYSTLIKPEISVYPGENNSWDSFPYSLFSYKNDYPNAQCNNNHRCSVAILNSDKQIEIHNSNVIVKEGKSPQYRAAFPYDSLYINAVEGDDYIVSLASQAYFLSKTKTHSYLEDYDGSKAIIAYNGYEKHTVNVTLARENQKAREKINQAIEKIGRQKFNFVIDDLEYVNLFYYKDPSLWGLGNYNSKTINDTFSKIVNNKHIGYYFVEQGGMGERFLEEAGGGILLYYDGVAYDDANASVTTNINHVIYVPDNTANNPESFAAAAQKRINQYLGRKSGVVVNYAGHLEDSESNGLDQYIDMTGFDGNYYKIAYKDKVEDILILKNSSKIKKSTFVASDVSSNITVTSDNANYPTNTVVSSESINENTDNYRALMNKLGLKKAQVVDMDLYSPTTGDIKDFNNVDFDVSVPIDETKVEGNQLYAYYIGDDGKIEEHPITKDDFMGTFKTTHFSTYIISGKIDDRVIEEANNPRTNDDIAIWIMTGSVSVLGLIFAAVTIIRKKQHGASS